MFKIEKNVPISKTINPRMRWDMPLDEMAVGDSFLVPTAKGVDPKDLRSRVAVALSRKSRSVEGTFSSRVVKNGIRIWRVA